MTASTYKTRVMHYDRIQTPTVSGQRVIRQTLCGSDREKRSLTEIGEKDWVQQTNALEDYVSGTDRRGRDRRHPRTDSVTGHKPEPHPFLRHWYYSRLSRHTTSYAELEGVEVKISDRYRYCNITFIHQVELMCMTLRDLTKLQEKYDYSFHREHEVLQNFDMEKLIQPTA
ncbi:hypothetical protein BaRGS_00011907 [Batillaria attramentaria]|uniref:UMA domain-containing protein n=1 Tax=Batillaria attramentaria TaxID=370345 RepID=A0ABD0LC00_9CAEN